MRLFNNTYFRWFAGGFLVGASVVAMVRTTDSIKDLKIEAVSGRTVFTGPSAWVIVGVLLGIFCGVLGLGVGGLKKWLQRV